MNELNVGIVGLGWVAGAHIETFKSVSGARVGAVCSRRRLDEKELESTYGVPIKVYSRYEDMLADPSIDIVDICTPHKLHAQQAIAAAQAGKHLIIEKPVCLTFDDLVAMKGAIEKAGVGICVCFECRFSDHFNMIQSCISEGLLGEIHYAEVDYYHGIGPWYNQFQWNVKKSYAGSSLLTAGCHALDGLLLFMDGKIEEVNSYGTRSSNPIFSPYEYDTTSVTLLKFKDGRLGKVASVVDCVQPYYFHIHLVGSEGSLLDNRLYSRRLHGLSKQVWSTLETQLIDSGDVSHHPYEPQFQAFVESLHQKTAMRLTGVEEAWESHKVVFAADRSAQERRPVMLSEFD